MVMKKVTDAMEYVMDGMTASDECDGYDGKNQKSSELKNSPKTESECNTQSEVEKEKKEISKEFLKMPSHGSRYPLEPTVMDSLNVVTVGSKVTISNCPGHWASFSPFTVEDINGRVVKLEMIGDLVDINRLCKCKNAK